MDEDVNSALLSHKKTRAEKKDKEEEQKEKQLGIFGSLLGAIHSPLTM